MTRRQKRRPRNAKRRDRAQNTIKTVTSGAPRGGEPVGRFFRPLRRLRNYVAHGEYLERRVAAADSPAEREDAQRALALQIVKVERTARRLAR